MDLVTVAVGGMAVLIVLAVLVGLTAHADAGSRRHAWRAIARERRENWEAEARLRELDDALLRCRDCPFRPRRPPDVE